MKMEIEEEENYQNPQKDVSSFRSILPKNPKRKNGGHGKIQTNSRSRFIKTQCVRLMNQILDTKIQDTVKRVFKTIVQNTKQKNSIIIALHLKRNQRDDLQRFIQRIDKFQFQKTQTLASLYISSISKQDVRDIALQIHTKQDNLRKNYSMNGGDIIIHPNSQVQIDLRKHLQVYVPRRITNLSQQNIHVFEQTVIQGHYAVILPTFQSLKIIDGQGILQDQSQKYFFQAYSNKELFIQFFYRSIVSKSIMAYLPPQALKLIKMYDYYPLSYQQGCHMFIYACQLFDHKWTELKRPQRKLVELKQLVRIFNRTWKSLFKHLQQLSDQIIKYNYQQLCNCFLNQKAIYTVSQAKIQSLLSLFSVEQSYTDNVENKKIYQIFEKKFKSKLKEQKSLNYLLDEFDKFDEKRAQGNKIQIKSKKNQRVAKLGFTGPVKNAFKGEKHFFEEKITHIFKVASQEIRKQSIHISWDQINVLNLMRPQLLLDTVKGVIQQPDFRDVFDTIRSYAHLPMARLIQQFKNMSIGRLVYIVRCLQYKGLVDTNRNTLKPSLMTDFFEKATFRMAEQ